jgi:hypothetical protein
VTAGNLVVSTTELPAIVTAYTAVENALEKNACPAVEFASTEPKLSFKPLGKKV